MDTTLKQRLIGAVVLIALAVIFLPMLIKGPAPDSGVSDVSTKVPDAPEGQFVEIPLNTVGEVPAGGALGLKPGAAAPATPSASAAVPLGADTAVPASTALPATTAGGDYAVNFGAYATPADAAQMVAMLKQAQLPGFSESATINGKPAWRVRIGPYADRAQAEMVRLEAAKVRNDVNAQVVALDAQVPAAAPATASTAQATSSATVTTQQLPPEPARPAAPKPEPAKPVATATPRASQQPQAGQPVETKPASPPLAAPATTSTTTAPKPATTATAPAKPATTGYAVQVGAFANAASATALRDKLRASGFSAFVEQVRTDSGVQNRVRVGPVATRAAADQLKSQVTAKAGVSGQVRPHP